MCDEPASTSSQSESAQSDQGESELSLLDLPIEIFLHICSFLDASTLVHGLSLVCKHFHRILSDDSLWKVRISQVWPNTGYPVLPPAEDDDLFWKLSCVEIEKQASVWKKKDSMEKLPLYNVQYSTIDSLLLMHNGTICISGARDRSIVYWKLPVEDDEKGKAKLIDPAHSGWIWDLTSIDNTVYSCSWDGSVKAWTLTNTGLVHNKTYNMMSALLCVASCPDLGLFSTGSFCKTVLVFDPRSGDRPIAKYQPHQKAVLGLTMSSRFILSASEDKTLSIFDQQAGKIMRNVEISKESFPMSMCMQRNMVYVGDSKAKLHVLDPNKDFEPVKCYVTGHTKSITGVRLAPGCLITCSKDMTVKISSPTDPPQHLATLTAGFGEIAGFDYLNEVLAISGTEGIEIWRPKTNVPSPLKILL